MLQPSTVRKIIKELGQLRADPPEDIRVQLDEEDVLQFVGIIAGPEGTPYHGGYFKVRFTFADEFPAAPPKCTFTTKIFHPNVSPSGDICVSTLKKDWKPTYGITHILTVIKCLLIYPNPESALDEEAGKMLLDDYEGYCKRARLMTSIHATRGGIPPEFETTEKSVQLSDPMGISFLDSLGPSDSMFPSGSDSIFSPSKPTRAHAAPIAGPSTSTSSRPMIHHPTSPKRAAVASAASREASPSASPLSPTATTTPMSPNLHPLSPTLQLLSPTLTPSGLTLTIPPLRSSAQSANGAARLSPAPSGPNEKEPATSTSTGGAGAGAGAGKKDGSKSREGKGGGAGGGASSGKAVKRPASAVSGGVKEKGNGAEKRKKGLKRL